VAPSRPVLTSGSLPTLPRIGALFMLLRCGSLC
jgi:hypothetical protein